MGEDSNNTLDQLRIRIDEIVKERPSHKEALEFLKEVMAEQYRMRTEIKITPVSVGREKTQALMEGVPLLDKKVLSFDVPSSTKLFKKLCGFLGRKEDTSMDAKRLSRALRNKDLDLMELFNNLMTQDGEYKHAISRKLKVNEDLLLFLAENSVRPIFRAYANELKGHVDQETWQRGYCPICGAIPLIAELREDGARFLICSLCGFEWRFARLKCPSCGNDDHETLRYFYAESTGKANRIDVCEKCKNYVKTFDIKEMVGEIIPIIEDMGTLYLDVLAQQGGYVRGRITHRELRN
jgi:FdhE protein